MKWISNAKTMENLARGTIFQLDKTAVLIHHYVGYGERWFLKYSPLGISMHDLGTEDFSVAKEKAYQYIEDVFDKRRRVTAQDLQKLSVSLREKDDFSRF